MYNRVTISSEICIFFLMGPNLGYECLTQMGIQTLFWIIQKFWVLVTVVFVNLFMQDWHSFFKN